ncbi:DUF763 domain-containing protein [Olivibacter sp. SDN3]|uniref:DUF763 domain-containing protein n=1 Tax=Olivibacter sp. SDN3 TaxID=2764720 RepID=UPI001650D9F3|nr:DUF763 domain-containing protein [Olivibacter sp. SDN3]QNL49610.1 DUF763 domain-containing protein [Olivibacter sp. SDN3]
MKGNVADLPLHYGRVPLWLAERMSSLGGAIVEAIVMEYGVKSLLQKMSDPCWFQSLGCVLGMDWHSSGVTTAVIGALKRAVNKRSAELGVYICGGRGKYALQTPREILGIADKAGLDGDSLVKSSKLAAKVDNNAIQDGYQIYLHSFILTNDGDWAVIQQGMNTTYRMARRYHWHSPTLGSFTETPHSFVYGINEGLILNLTAPDAKSTRHALVDLAKENTHKIITEVSKLVMPMHHDVRAQNVNLKRLGAVLTRAQQQEANDLESLLLLDGVGSRTIQALTLVSEVIHGTASRFDDPARFSFAHGGKDGYPFPVPTNIYDESIVMLENALHKAKLRQSDKYLAIKNLSKVAEQMEKDFIANDSFDKVVAIEKANARRYGGRTAKRTFTKENEQNQLALF